MGKTNKPNWKTYRDIGIQELKLSKYLLACKSFKSALNNPPSNVIEKYFIQVFLARTYYLMSCQKNAVKILKELFTYSRGIWELANHLSYKIDFGNIYYLNQSLNIFTKHIKEDKNLLKKEKVDYLIELFWLMGFLNRKLENYEESIINFSWSLFLLKQHPRSYDQLQEDYLGFLYADRSIAYYLGGNIKEAFSDINKSIENNSFCYRAYIHAGLIHQEYGNFNMAISMFEQAIYEYSEIYEPYITDISRLYINKCFAEFKIGNIENAINDFHIGFSKDKKFIARNQAIIKLIPESLKNIIRIKFQISFK